MKNYSQWTKTSLTATLLTFSFSSISFAGIDVSCTSSTQLQFNSYDACNNLPALTPVNDNRTNMLLLLSDLGLAKLNFDLNKKETLYYTNYSIVPFEAISLIENAANQSPNARLNKKINLENDQEHCNSLKAGQDEFVQQVKADKRVSPTEQTILIRARTQLNACKNDMGFIHVEPNWSIQTRQYASYLNGTIAFYNANFSTASHIYSALTQVEQAWIKETAQYMLIRCQLNLAHQSGVAEYGDLDRSKINPKTVVALFDSITAYFKAYPNGRYAASARGFLRRGFTFNNRQDLLINELVWQINNPKSKVYNLELNNLPYEIDRQIFQSESFNVQNLKDPFFLTIYDLMHMRKAESAKDQVLSWAELNNQNAYFKDQPALFQYLQASHLFYVQNKADEALKYLPENLASSSGQYLTLSQTLLKGRILEKLGQTANAQQIWENGLNRAKNTDQRGLFELMLYPYYAKKQNAKLFSDATAKIKQASLQKHFIESQANEQSLMYIIQDKATNIDQKNLALFTVLQKSLIHHNYQLFNTAYLMLPNNAAQFRYDDEKGDYIKHQPPLSMFMWKGVKITNSIQCPDLFTLSQKLEHNPKDFSLRLCLGEYIRSEQGYRLNSLTYSEKDSSTFQGSIFARGQVYKDLIKSSTDADLKAYALYRSIMCYSPSGSNDCQDGDVPKTMRKQWYDQIKLDYPNTTWAKSLKYYW